MLKIKNNNSAIEKQTVSRVKGSFCFFLFFMVTANNIGKIIGVRKIAAPIILIGSKNKYSTLSSAKNIIPISGIRAIISAITVITLIKVVDWFFFFSFCNHQISDNNYTKR